MDVIFLKLLNMSIAAGWLILAVIVLRLLLKKAPKSLVCILWAVVAIRLLCPFSVESSFSLIPSAETLSPAVVRYAAKPAIDSGISFIDHTLNPIIGESFAPDIGASVNPLQIWVYLGSILWIIGLLGLLGYALVSFIRIHVKVREAVPLWDNIWICDAVKSPFILGIIRPRIYLSSGMEGEQMGYVLAHEQAHLKRRDHWWKPLGFLLLSVYWYHPLVWVAYVLLCRDIEIACDEKVIKDMDMNRKKAYSNALVACSTQRSMILACPLAFGEVGVKERVKAVLNYRKPAFWLIAAAILACAVVTVCFLTNPEQQIIDNGFDLVEEIPSDSNNMVLATEENPDSTEMIADSMKLEYSDTSALSEGRGADTAESALEAAISAAIIEKNASPYMGFYNFGCCDFVPLGTSYEPLTDGDDAQVIVCYGWALYQQYIVSEKGIEDIGGSHIPVALTFEQHENEYVLKEYWEPRDGSYYVRDIRDKFPEDIAEDGIDSQKFILQQVQSCYKQAVQFWGLDTDVIIENLLNNLCPDDGSSSLDYYPLVYRELTYYGEYTLRYCFNRFLQGNETGRDGRMMAMICEELLQTKGSLPVDAATARTGQLWYDTLLAHAGNLVEPYLILPL